MPTYNLPELKFRPANFGEVHGENYDVKISQADDNTQIIIGLDIRTDEGSGWIAIVKDEFDWVARSQYTTEWPTLDKALGRKEWQNFLEEFERSARARFAEEFDE